VRYDGIAKVSSQISTMSSASAIRLGIIVCCQPSILDLSLQLIKQCCDLVYCGILSADLKVSAGINPEEIVDLDRQLFEVGWVFH
jgi:hypothetical protein